VCSSYQNTFHINLHIQNTTFNFFWVCYFFCYRYKIDVKCIRNYFAANIIRLCGLYLDLSTDILYLRRITCKFTHSPLQVKSASFSKITIDRICFGNLCLYVLDFSS